MGKNNYQWGHYCMTFLLAPAQAVAPFLSLCPSSRLSGKANVLSPLSQNIGYLLSHSALISNKSGRGHWRGMVCISPREGFEQNRSQEYQSTKKCFCILSINAEENGWESTKIQKHLLAFSPLMGTKKIVFIQCWLFNQYPSSVLLSFARSADPWEDFQP